MEAKDTVMDIGEDKYDGLGVDTLVEIQAEISFKAGQIEGRNEIADLMHHARIYLSQTEETKWAYWIDDEEWQAKLKEWGVV